MASGRVLQNPYRLEAYATLPDDPFDAFCHASEQSSIGVPPVR
jgi:hypothetical protein